MPLSLTEFKKQTAELKAAIPSFTCQAMNSVFMIMPCHEDPQHAKGAALEAFDIIKRLEEELSRFVPYSDLSRLNRAAVGETVIIGADLFACLERCAELYAVTGGFFDITLGEWADAAKRSELTRHSKPLIMEQGPFIELDPERSTAAKTRPASLDLGGFGKGYALDRAAAHLVELEVNAALLSGGQSSLLALDAAPGFDGWPISLSRPGGGPFAVYPLRKEALGASGNLDQTHIIDPSAGLPLSLGQKMAWALAPEAGAADALATAFLIMPMETVRVLCAGQTAVKAVLCDEAALENINNWDLEFL